MHLNEGNQESESSTLEPICNCYLCALRYQIKMSMDMYHYLSIHYSGITFLIFPAVIFLLRSISFHLFFFYIYLGRMTFVNFMESQVTFFRFVFVFFLLV